MIFQKSACIETLYTELPFLERFHAAKADGFEFVEFWSWTDKDLAAGYPLPLRPQLTLRGSSVTASTATRSCPLSTLPRKRPTRPFCGVLWTPRSG